MAAFVAVIHSETMRRRFLSTDGASTTLFAKDSPVLFWGNPVSGKPLPEPGLWMFALPRRNLGLEGVPIPRIFFVALSASGIALCGSRPHILSNPISVSFSPVPHVFELLFSCSHRQSLPLNHAATSTFRS